MTTAEAENADGERRQTVSMEWCAFPPKARPFVPSICRGACAILRLQSSVIVVTLKHGGFPKGRR